MSVITLEESRLQDVRRANKHSAETGYDYTKSVQREIQTLVELEIEFYLESPRRKSIGNIVPKPGIYNNTIVIKEEDCIAYKESHPQVAAPSTKRKNIIRILKSGGSTLDTPSENSKKKGRASNKKNEKVKVRILLVGTHEELDTREFNSKSDYSNWFRQNIGSSGNLVSNQRSTVSGYDYDVVVSNYGNEMEVARKKEPEKDPYIAFVTPDNYYPPLSPGNTHTVKKNTFAMAEGTGSQANSIIGSIKKESEIRVLETNVGNGEYAIADSEAYSDYGVFFILMKDIEIKNGIKQHPKNMSHKLSLPDSNSMSIDWTLKNYDTPYYDPLEAKYKVAVATSFERLNSETSLEAVMMEGFRKGSEILLSNLGKINSNQIIEDIENSEYYDKPIRATDFYVDDRKGSKIIVLVESPNKYLTTFQEKVSGNFTYYCEDYDVSTFEEQIEQICKKIDSIQDSMEKYEGEILNFNPKKERENLSLIPFTISDLFKKNGLSKNIFSEKGFLTIKWGYDFNLISLEFESEDASRRVVAKKGLRESLSKPHMESQRIQHILYNMQEICSTGLDSSWIDFLENYFSYDDVEIISAQSKFISSSSGEKEADWVKTLDELLKEKKYYSNIERRIEKSLARKTEQIFSGSALLDSSNISALREKLNLDSNSAYDSFLNNVDFRKIVFNAIDCLIPEKVSEEFDNIRNQARTLEDDINKYKRKISSNVKKARKIKSQTENAIEDGLDYIKTGGKYLAKIEREFKDIDSRLSEIQLGSVDLSFDSGELFKSNSFLEEIKEAELSKFEESLKRPYGINFDSSNSKKTIFKKIEGINPGNPLEEVIESAVHSLEQMSSEQAEKISRYTNGISDSVLDSFSTSDGIDSITQELLSLSGMDITLGTDIALGTDIQFKKISHFPEIKFNDNLFTDDISESFFNNLVDSISSAANEKIKSLVNSALDASSICSSNASNRRNKSGNNPPKTDIEGNERDNAAEVDKGVVFDYINKTFPPDSVTPDKIQDILDDVGNLLSPREFCDLLNGKPNDVVLDIVSRVMQVEYGELQINTRSRIADFFYTLSRFTNYDNCSDIIDEELPDLISDDYLCPPNTSFRDSILKSKGLSDKQISDQLKRERGRSKKMAEKLLDQIRDGLLSGDSEAPNNFCSTDSKGNPLLGQESFMDENMKYSFSSTLNKTFEPIYNSFRKDSQEYIESLFSQSIREAGQADVGTQPPVPERIPLPDYRDFLRPDKFSEIKDILRYQGSKISIRYESNSNKSPPAGLDLSEFGIFENDNAKYYTSLERKGIQSEGVLYEIFSGNFVKTMSVPMSEKVKNHIESYQIDELSEESIFQEMITRSYERYYGDDFLESHREKIRTKASRLYNITAKRAILLLLDQVADSPYFSKINEDAEGNSEYVLDYINVCPPATSTCDPHLLRVKEEVDKIQDKFNTDMCTENQSTIDPSLPPRTPLESSMLGACMRLTIRHYIAETILKGIFSLQSLTGSKASEILVDYISTNMQFSMSTYQDYFPRFLKELQEMVGDSRSSKYDILKKVIKEEYNQLSEMIFKCLMVSTTRISTKSMFATKVPRITYDDLEYDPVTENHTTNVHFLRKEKGVDLLRDMFVIVSSSDKTYYCLFAPSDDLPPKRRSYEPDNLLRSFMRPIRVESLNGNRSELRTLVPLFESVNTVGRTAEFSTLFELVFPIDSYASLIMLNEIEIISKKQDVRMAYGDTRDNLYSTFMSLLPQENDWKKESPALKDIARRTGMSGASGLTDIWDFNFGVKDPPASENTFNYGLPVNWGSDFSGLFFNFAAKATRDAALKTFKDFAERADLNIMKAKEFSDLAKLAGINIPTTAISIAISPMLPYTQTPVSYSYNALGLGSFAKNKINLNDAGDEKVQQTKRKLESLGLKVPQFCQELIED